MIKTDITPLHEYCRQIMDGMSSIETSFKNEGWNDHVHNSYESYLKQLNVSCADTKRAADNVERVMGFIESLNLEDKIDDAEKLCDEADKI